VDAPPQALTATAGAARNKGLDASGHPSTSGR